MSASAVVDLRNSFGAAYVGLIVSTTLFGLTLAQAWIYFWHFWNKDPKALKIFIAFITVMEVFHTILCAYMIYWYLVLNFGNVESVGNSMWAIDIQANVQSIYTSVVHCYYARRIYIISKSIFLPMVIVVIIISGNIIGIYIATKQLSVKQVSKRFHAAAWLPYVGLCEIVVMDALIAAMMCWALYRKKTGFARTDSIIMTLMAYTINSGLVSCVLGIAMFVCFVAAPSSLFSLAIFLVMGKCYVNSMLAMLNSRNFISDRLTDNTDNAFNLSSIRIAAPRDAQAESRQSDVSVTLHRSTTPEFARRKSDNNVATTSIVQHLDTTTIPCQSQSQTSEL